ncbi:hypothetical protein DIPPA_08515 [Diplonema papillatum]|nr:hypothetical protein DIPPA_08515 [Diplonema papillatum]
MAESDSNGSATVGSSPRSDIRSAACSDVGSNAAGTTFTPPAASVASDDAGAELPPPADPPAAPPTPHAEQQEPGPQPPSAESAQPAEAKQPAANPRAAGSGRGRRRAPAAAAPRKPENPAKHEAPAQPWGTPRHPPAAATEQSRLHPPAAATEQSRLHPSAAATEQSRLHPRPSPGETRPWQQPAPYAAEAGGRSSKLHSVLGAALSARSDAKASILGAPLIAHGAGVYSAGRGTNYGGAPARPAHPYTPPSRQAVPEPESKIFPAGKGRPLAGGEAAEPPAKRVKAEPVGSGPAPPFDFAAAGIKAEPGLPPPAAAATADADGRLPPVKGEPGCVTSSVKREPGMGPDLGAVKAEPHPAALPPPAGDFVLPWQVAADADAYAEPARPSLSLGGLPCMRAEGGDAMTIDQRDALIGIMRAFPKQRWADSLEVVLSLRNAAVAPHAISAVFAKGHTAKKNTGVPLGELLSGFPTIFMHRIVWSTPELEELVGSGGIACPKGRYPPLPVLLFKMRPAVEKDVVGFVLRHFKTLRLPVLPKTCRVCRSRGDGSPWVGHYELQCTSPDATRDRFHDGVPLPLDLARGVARRAALYAKAYKAAANAAPTLQAAPSARQLQNELKAVIGVVIPAVNLKQLIGKSGSNLRRLQQHLKVSIIIPRMNYADCVTVKGLPEKAIAAKEFLEQKYGNLT